MLLKNVGSQGIYLYEYVAATGLAKTGDSANITGYYSLDGGVATVFATANPTELSATHQPGVYWQPLAQAETNGNAFGYGWTSTTSGCVVVPIIGFTTGVSLPVAAPAANGGLPTCDASNGVKVSVGTGTGQINAASGKVPATLANTDVTGNVACDLQTIKTQTVTCAAGVTVGAFVGNATAALAVDASGRVDLGKILGTASAGAAGYAGVDWAHVNAPTTTVNLSGTTISTGQAVASVSGAVGSVTGSVGSVTGAVASVTGNVGGSVGSIAGQSFPANFAALAIDTGGNVKIQGSIKRNTALAAFEFLMVRSSDHVTPATGATVTAVRSLDGAAPASCANGVTEVGAGLYKIDLAAADLNGAVVTLEFSATNCDTTYIMIVTQP